MPIQEKLLRWKEAERRAVEAEAQLKALAPGPADEAAAQLALRARALRREADSMFGALMRQITGDSGATPK